MTDAVDPADIWPDFIARLPKKSTDYRGTCNKADITGETLATAEVNGHSLVRPARTGEARFTRQNRPKQSMGRIPIWKAARPSPSPRRWRKAAEHLSSAAFIRAHGQGNCWRKMPRPRKAYDFTGESSHVPPWFDFPRQPSSR
ncbi:hypothetical protein KCP78_19415 [Salmonella enterica subsp. enterica]|nr:hypothetical protein KCP78_19415 [Salmonella enterica subsp. enterica]